MIADHPYIACLLTLCVGGIWGFCVALAFIVRANDQMLGRNDDDITGIGA